MATGNLSRSPLSESSSSDNLNSRVCK